MTPDSLAIPSLLGGKPLSSLSEADMELATSLEAQAEARATLDACSHRATKRVSSVRVALAESLKR